MAIHSYKYALELVYQVLSNIRDAGHSYRGLGMQIAGRKATHGSHSSEAIVSFLGANY